MARRRLLASIAVEFALVVVGVLVALWVNDWHQARQDREAAVGLLARMEELFADAFDLAVAEHRARARLWVLDGVLARLGDRNAESRLTPARADSMVYPLRLDSLARRRLGRSVVPYEVSADPLAPFRARGNFDLSKATYEEMLATGRVRLVGDGELRASIVTYYQLAVDIGANEDRDPYYEQLEDAFASIDVAFGGSLSLDELAARGRQVPSFPVTVRRAQNRMRTLIQYYGSVERTRQRLERALARYRAGR